MRSCLHAPANRADLLGKLASRGADAIVIEHARRIVDGFVEAALRGRGSVVHGDGTFVDEASRKRARRLRVVAARHAKRDRP
jgi:citrate lyase beta subunit